MHIKAFKAKICNYKTPYLRQNQNKTNMADNLPTIFMHSKKSGFYTLSTTISQVP